MRTPVLQASADPQISVANPGAQTNAEGDWVSPRIGATADGAKAVIYKAMNLPLGLPIGGHQRHRQPDELRRLRGIRHGRKRHRLYVVIPGPGQADPLSATRVRRRTIRVKAGSRTRVDMELPN